MQKFQISTKKGTYTEHLHTIFHESNFKNVTKNKNLISDQYHPFFWCWPVLEIPTVPPVRGLQLWRRTRNFLLIFLQIHVYYLRFKAWGPTTFWLSFKHWCWLWPWFWSWKVNQLGALTLSIYVPNLRKKIHPAPLELLRSHHLFSRRRTAASTWIHNIPRSFRYGGSWWRHQMETFSALLAISAGNSPITGEFPTQRPVTQIFDVFLDLRLNKRLSKQSWGWWFETPLRSFWRHCNDILMCYLYCCYTTWATYFF